MINSSVCQGLLWKQSTSGYLYPPPQLKGTYIAQEKTYNLHDNNRKKDEGEYVKDMEPEENKSANCKLFCFKALAEEFNNTI